eukprot:g1497.t1
MTLSMHAMISAIVGSLAIILPVFTGYRRKSLCNAPALCKITTFLLYLSYIVVTVSVTSISVVFNRMVMKPLKWRGHFPQKTVEKPALALAYIGGLIVSLISTFGGKSEPYRVYCAISRPMTFRLFFYSILLIINLVSLAFIVPVIFSLGLQVLKSRRKRSGSEKESKKKNNKKNSIESRQLRVVKKFSFLIMLYSGAVFVASIPRFTESFRYPSYYEMMESMAQKGTSASRLTEIVVAGAGLIVYAMFGLMDERFVKHSFWSYVFGTCNTKVRKSTESSRGSSTSTSSVGSERD